MAINSLKELSEIINQQKAPVEATGIELLKAKAMTTIALEMDFSTHSKLNTYAYLWALEDVLIKVQGFNEESLNALSRAVLH